MASTASSTRMRRAPSGMDNARPVPIRMSTAERSRAEKVAEREQRTLASVCRLAMLKGLDCYDSDPASLTRTA